MTESERVRAVRKAESLTLEEFGKRLGVGKTAISKIESGVRGLTDQMCRSICREFSVREEWLRCGEEPMREESPSDELDEVLNKWGLPREFRGLFQAYRNLKTDTEREAVRRFIRDAGLEMANEEKASAVPAVPAASPAPQSQTDRPEGDAVPLSRTDSPEEEAVPLSEAEIDAMVADYRALLKKGRAVRLALGHGTPPQTKASGDISGSGIGGAGDDSA